MASDSAAIASLASVQTAQETKWPPLAGYRFLLVRHEERDLHTPTFECELTEDGARQSETALRARLEELLREDDQGAILLFSSPYPRAAQTIAPLARSLGVQVKFDYCLAEHLENPKHWGDDKRLRRPRGDGTVDTARWDRAAREFCMDPEHDPEHLFESGDIQQPESHSHMAYRVMLFVDWLAGQQAAAGHGCGGTVVLSTHQGPVGFFMQYLFRLYGAAEAPVDRASVVSPATASTFHAAGALKRRKEALVEAVRGFEKRPAGTGGKQDVWMGSVWEVDLRGGRFAAPTVRNVHAGRTGLRTVGDHR